MRDNLDKWIKDAREVTPDSGEYRRLNRVLVKERMKVAEPGRKRHHRLLIFSVSLLILVIFSGKISQLGGNGFDFIKKREVNLLGDTLSFYYDGVGTARINLPDSLTDAEVEAYKQSLAAGEGKIIKVTGLSYGGKTQWLKILRREVLGRESIDGRATESPVSEYPKDFEKFMLANMEELVARAESLPPHAEAIMLVDGIMVDFDIWTFEYPGYGKVTWYVGFPVEKQ